MLLVLAAVAVVIGVDVLFLRDHVTLRLTVNIGIVLVFYGLYWMFFRHS